MPFPKHASRSQLAMSAHKLMLSSALEQAKNLHEPHSELVLASGLVKLVLPKGNNPRAVQTCWRL